MDEESIDVGPLDAAGIWQMCVPHLLIALPESFPEGLPLNGLLAEWAVSLDPVGSLRDAAQEAFADHWRPERVADGDWRIVLDVVDAAPEVVHWVRSAAEDEGVLASLNAAQADLVTQEGTERTEIKALTDSEYDVGSVAYRSRISNAGMPILLGLAAIASLRTPVGPQGRTAQTFIAQSRRESSA